MNPAIWVLIGAAVGLGVMYFLLIRSADKKIAELKHAGLKKARRKKK